MRTTYITAAVIAVLIALWLLSGQFGKRGTTSHPTLAERNLQQDAALEDQALTRVRARVIHAVAQSADVVIRGRTRNKRTVEVRSQVSGRVTGRPVERGTHVHTGDLLCRISMEDRQARFNEAKAALNQAQIDYKGSLRLMQKGFQSETAIAAAKTRLAAADAQLDRARLEIEHTHITAPFDGVVEDINLEIGDVVQPGTTCITLVDLNPMLITGRVAERDVYRLHKGLMATGTLVDGTSVSGGITFIGNKADAATRTYAVEIEVPNPDYSLRSGITTEIRIPVEHYMAQRVSPALLALDDAGNLGIRTLNAENKVEFHAVVILRDDGGDIWVRGLPEVTTLITVGQELVIPGEAVTVSFEASDEMPASVPAAETSNKKPSDEPHTSFPTQRKQRIQGTA